VNSFIRGFKTIQQAGLVPVLQLGLYRFGLITGHYERLTPAGGRRNEGIEPAWLGKRSAFSDSALTEFFKKHPETAEQCRVEAGMILSGKCRSYGNRWVDIFRSDVDFTQHWTDYEKGKVSLPEKDIKDIWEPARLGWVFTLGRAKAAGHDLTLGQRSWSLLEKFLNQNQVNCGPNWMNGQEVALRILALAFFHEVFQEAPGMPDGWKQTLAQAVADHARRIPPTLVYARSQQNNHLLVEAAGLYTAGVFLLDYPEAAGWRKSGWDTFHTALRAQIQTDGTYAQFSTNYHRLMLQTALWMKALSLRAGDDFPASSMEKLAAATRWLADLTDAATGRVPNYGHNDGAYILPLTGKEFADYRPVVQTARFFFEPDQAVEARDEMLLWFEWLAGRRLERIVTRDKKTSRQCYRKLEDGDNTAILFSPRFDRRPGQADLLHLEFWRNGQALLLDAGTYRYNADPPWQNALAHTRVHNTLTINSTDQMLKAGRFLWLDWPVSCWVEDPIPGDRMTARHDGYRRFGVTHERTVRKLEHGHWTVVDRLLPVRKAGKPFENVCLQWLMPVKEWHITPDGLLTVAGDLEIRPGQAAGADGSTILPEYQVIIAGEAVCSSPGWPVQDNLSTLGWYSPTYGTKEPALSFRAHYCGNAPLSILTDFIVC
jgi:hypothetical protein